MNELVYWSSALLCELVILTNVLGGFLHQPFSLLLCQLERVAMQNFGEMTELIALTTMSSETAMDLLFEIIELESSCLLVEPPPVIKQFVNSLFGIARDHVDEAPNCHKPKMEPLRLAIHDYEDGYSVVRTSLRLDFGREGERNYGG